MKRVIPILFLAAAIFAMAGCSIMPPHAARPRYYDFGPPAMHSRLDDSTVVLRRVSAPLWLDKDGILYRLLDHEPARLRSYAEHRWIAPPPVLFAHAVREGLVTDRQPLYTLTLSLERFEQDFVDKTHARAEIRIRATLEGRGGVVLAVREFRDAADTTPDVEGAIKGLSTLANKAVRHIIQWATTQTKG